MIHFEYNQTQYESLISQYARQFGVKLCNNKITLPKRVGYGTIRIINLPNGLQVYLSDYTLKQEIVFHRKKNNKQLYFLRFEDMTLLNADNTSKSAIVLSVTSHDQIFLHPANARIRVVSVLFNKEWINKFFQPSATFIKKYLSSNERYFSYELMDTQYRTALNELFEMNVEEFLEIFMISNRIMLLLERFFTRLFLKENHKNYYLSHKFSDEEIDRIKEVEAELIKDFSQPVSVKDFSRMAMMSASRMKIVFKEMFGLPMYKYYQKQRMNKAKAMILSGNYSLAEISNEVGFLNLAGFIKAFQKTFGQQPQDILPE